TRCHLIITRLAAYESAKLALTTLDLSYGKCVSRFHLFSLSEPATSGIYTLSLHDALPISRQGARRDRAGRRRQRHQDPEARTVRSEEHTSELQSHLNLVCRLLLEKKKDITQQQIGDRQ